MNETLDLLDQNINYESLLNTFFNIYPDALWIKDKNFNLIKANTKYQKFLKNIDSSSKLTNDRNIIKEGKSKTFSLRSDDKRNVLSITAIPIADENKNSDNILFISKNITEQEDLKERFFVNKYQLNALLDNIPKIIYMKDLEGNYITGTKFSRDFFNNSYDYFHKIQLKASSAKRNTAIDDKTVINNNKLLSYETEILDITGIPHWYTIYKAPINDYNNNAIGIVVMINNIDDEKLLQAQKETFVASLGHDLKNPTLAQIRAIELLLKGEFGSIPKEQVEILEMILDSCKYMKAMLGSLLATYRNERGAVALNYEDFSLLDLANDCISEMVYLAKDKNIQITVYKNFHKPTVFADKVQIKRVIMNLISNGIKYANKNSEIKIKIYNEDNFTCYSLENSSPYIPESQRDAIFAQYVSYAEAHNELGIGLGLYASKKIIDAHAGKIYVESFEDNRNIFGFKIPNLQNKNAKKAVSF